MTRDLFILKLHDIEAIKFGDFTLKSGLKSPFYFDLRDMISYPEILNGIVDLIVERIKDIDFDYITGIPYTALPIATLIADITDKPLIYVRKEEKAYGTKNNIIGKFSKGGKCLIIDDLITTGESIIETAEIFKKEGIKVSDVAVIIERSYDARNKLKEIGFNLHSIIQLDEALEILKSYNRISNQQVSDIKKFTRSMTEGNIFGKNFENKLTKKLKEIIALKQSNLVLSLDVDNQNDFFKILDKTAEHIVMLKTHIDTLNDFDDKFITLLHYYSKKYNFLIFEDRKFADIGNTVKNQYRQGVFKISEWADFVTVHAIPGEGILHGLFKGIENRACFLLAKMSSKGNLMNETYSRKVFEMGENNSELVSGYIGHAESKTELRKLKNKIPNGQLLLMPGVKLQKGNDDAGQQYTTVEEAIEGGADCIIVGRGIIESENPGETAKEYKQKAWELYKKL